MANTIEKWRTHQFSSGGGTGSDYLAFQKAAKADLKKQAQAAGYALHSFHPNHYCFTAVLRDEASGSFIYVSVSDVRFNSLWYDRVLHRTMAHEKDWTGGHNRYCAWPDIKEALEDYQMRRCG